MNLSALSATTPYTSTELQHNDFLVPTNGAAEEVAEALESVFSSMLIKEMRKTLSDGFFGGEQSDVMGGMFDMHLGSAMSEQQELGIKQMVLDEWAQRQAQPKQPSQPQGASTDLRTPG